MTLLRTSSGRCWLLPFWFSSCPSIGTTWVLTWRFVDLRTWAWDAGVLESPKLHGKCVHFRIFRSLVKEIHNFHHILKGILDPKGLNCQFNKTGVIMVQNSWIKVCQLHSAVKLLTNTAAFCDWKSVFFCCHHQLPHWHFLRSTCFKICVLQWIDSLRYFYWQKTRKVIENVIFFNLFFDFWLPTLIRNLVTGDRKPNQMAWRIQGIYYCYSRNVQIYFY